MRYASAVSFVAVLGVLTGCGETSNSSSTIPADTIAKATTPAMKIVISAPADGQTIRKSHVTVRGTVDPPASAVKVLGQDAKIEGGLFTKSVNLQPGENRIDVVATDVEQSPATAAVTVTRGRSEAALAAAHKRKQRAAAKKRAAKKRAAEKRAAEKQAAANATVAVPDETGARLDVAEDDLRSQGLRYKEIGGGTFGIIVKSNWTVCSTSPGPGEQVPKHTRVRLVVDRSC